MIAPIFTANIVFQKYRIVRKLIDQWLKVIEVVEVPVLAFETDDNVPR